MRVDLSEYDTEFIERCKFSSTRPTMTEAMQKMQWGTYGFPPVRENFKWVRLIDCSTDHLQRIMEPQQGIPDVCRDIIQKILDKRGAPYFRPL